jgi:hypothetical protein
MSREEIKDVATIIATLLLLPFIVYMLNAPMTAAVLTACFCWPCGWTLGILLIIEGSKRR